MATGKEHLAGTDESIKELDEKARTLLIDVIEKGRMNFIDASSILSDIISVENPMLSKSAHPTPPVPNHGCAAGCASGCYLNCVAGCSCPHPM